MVILLVTKETLIYAIVYFMYAAKSGSGAVRPRCVVKLNINEPSITADQLFK